MIRTQEEILAKIAAWEEDDFFGVMRGDLIDYLTFENAKPFLKEGAIEAEWAQKTADPLEELKSYLDFAWGKANDGRGLSADRSLRHAEAWLWLAGREDLGEFVKNHQYYGKPQLVMLSEFLGFDWRSQDDGVWTNGDYPIDEKVRDRLIVEAIGRVA